MAYQKKTLRRMRPKTRAMAKIINEFEKELRKMKKMVEVMDELEADSTAFWAKKKHDELKATKDPDEQIWKEESALAHATKNLPF